VPARDRGRGMSYGDERGTRWASGALESLGSFGQFM
jgi:hypothetical protein